MTTPYLTALRDANLGDVVVFDEQSPLPEVLSVVKHARLILGMHGSTLAPMIWAPRGCAVVEMLHGIPWLHWWATATALKHDYWLVPIDSARHDSATVAAPVALTLRTVRAALGLPDANETVATGSEEAKEESDDEEDELDKEWREEMAKEKEEWKDKTSSEDQDANKQDAQENKEILEKVQGGEKGEETIKKEGEESKKEPEERVE